MEGSRDQVVLVVKLTRPLDMRLIADALEGAGALVQEVRMAPEHAEGEA